VQTVGRDIKKQKLQSDKLNQYTYVKTTMLLKAHVPKKKKKKGEKKKKKMKKNKKKEKNKKG